MPKSDVIIRAPTIIRPPVPLMPTLYVCRYMEWKSGWPYNQPRWVACTSMFARETRQEVDAEAAEQQSMSKHDIPGQATFGGDDVPNKPIPPDRNPFVGLPKVKQKRRVYNLKKVVTSKGPEYQAFPKDEFREIDE